MILHYLQLIFDSPSLQHRRNLIVQWNDKLYILPTHATATSTPLHILRLVLAHTPPHLYYTNTAPNSIPAIVILHTQIHSTSARIPSTKRRKTTELPQVNTTKLLHLPTIVQCSELLLILAPRVLLTSNDPQRISRREIGHPDVQQDTICLIFYFLCLTQARTIWSINTT